MNTEKNGTKKVCPILLKKCIGEGCAAWQYTEIKNIVTRGGKLSVALPVRGECAAMTRK